MTPGGAAGARRLKLLTYNIHSGIGRDGRPDLGRVRRVLEDVRPDVAALQEIECRTGSDQVAGLASALPATGSFCPTRPAGDGSFGLATLSPLRVLRCENYDLSCPGAREPRFCLRTDLELEDGAVLHVFNCHLGLTIRERRFQRDRMLSDAVLFSRELRHPVVLMGDFNDSPVSVIHSSLRRHFQDAWRVTGKRWGPTFWAGFFPLRLDYIYAGPGIRVVDCVVPRDGAARLASDHYPLVATVELAPPEKPPD